ncbi:ABC transporter permease [Thermococcus guaymasensis DSM 11113]|uniref:ABC transporter permease n=1 Tax=Thermococcus guaymasensis DSM 11113 TaxID=1432656 RepID=A0A0X1KHY2_9EURY|nr:sugar ABC transporter permease [Thermococcus guaymasensis]AJC70869.1 ABC transporter permease [Thermococcus guaymasensis DSM 11113]
MAKKVSKYAPYLLVAPAIIYLAIFIGYPMIEGIKLVFYENGGFSLATVHRAVNNYYFWPALKNTLGLVAVIVPTQLILALVLALAMNKVFKGRNIALTLLLIPMTLSDIAAGLIWYSMLSPSGFMNKLLLNLGLIHSPIQLFGYQFHTREFLMLVFVELWRSTVTIFVIVLAGLQMISQEYIEAAEVFGAGYWTRLRHIVIPLLKPSIQTALLLRTIYAFSIFGIVWVLVGRDIPVLAGEAYYQVTQIKDYGVGAFYALLIAIMSLATGAVYLRLTRSEYLEVRR